MFTFPEDLGSCIDMLYDMQQARLEKKREFESFAKESSKAESDLEDHMIKLFGKENLEGARGSKATATVKHTTVPKVVDWDVFYAHIKETGHFELLQKRPTTRAYLERLDNGEVVPGVEPFHDTEISLHKR